MILEVPRQKLMQILPVWQAILLKGILHSLFYSSRKDKKCVSELLAVAVFIRWKG